MRRRQFIGVGLTGAADPKQLEEALSAYGACSESLRMTEQSLLAAHREARRQVKILAERAILGASRLLSEGDVRRAFSEFYWSYLAAPSDIIANCLGLTWQADLAILSTQRICAKCGDRLIATKRGDLLEPTRFPNQLRCSCAPLSDEQSCRPILYQTPAGLAWEIAA